MRAGSCAKIALWTAAIFMACGAIGQQPPPASVAEAIQRTLAKATNVPPRTMDRLLAQYKDFGLPLPPNGAQMVSCVFGEGEPWLGFLVKANDPAGLTWVLCGTEVYGFDSSFKITPCDPAVFDAGKIALNLPYHIAEEGDTPFKMNAALATALQCHALAYTNLATELAGRSPMHDYAFDKIFGDAPGGLEPDLSPPQPVQPGVQPAGERRLSIDAALGLLAFTHWGTELLKPASDWQAVSRRLKQVLATVPELDTEPRRELVQSLDETLQAPVPQPGSVEALLDEICRTPGYYRLQSDSNEFDSFSTNSPANRMVLLGFSAMPTLINHLTDNRLTCHVKEGGGNGHARIMRVHEVAE